MNNSQSRGRFWDQVKFRKLTEILSSKGEQAWPSIVEELLIFEGRPDFFIINARYGNKAVADDYDFGEGPVFRGDVVVVASPFPHLQPGQFIEMSEETARKVLVLGVP